MAGGQYCKYYLILQNFNSSELKYLHKILGHLSILDLCKCQSGTILGNFINTCFIKMLYLISKGIIDIRMKVLCVSSHILLSLHVYTVFRLISVEPQISDSL